MNHEGRFIILRLRKLNRAQNFVSVRKFIVFVRREFCRNINKKNIFVPF